MLAKDIKKIIVNETLASFWLVKKAPPILHRSRVQPEGGERERY